MPVENFADIYTDYLISSVTIYYSQLIKTVPGIGHLTAVYIICCTNNFASKVSDKQLSSYAGVVPLQTAAAQA